MRGWNGLQWCTDLCANTLQEENLHLVISLSHYRIILPPLPRPPLTVVWRRCHCCSDNVLCINKIVYKRIKRSWNTKVGEIRVFDSWHSHEGRVEPDLICLYRDQFCWQHIVWFGWQTRPSRCIAACSEQLGHPVQTVTLDWSTRSFSSWEFSSLALCIECGW